MIARATGDLHDYEVRDSFSWTELETPWVLQQAALDACGEGTQQSAAAAASIHSGTLHPEVG